MSKTIFEKIALYRFFRLHAAANHAIKYLSAKRKAKQMTKLYMELDTGRTIKAGQDREITFFPATGRYGLIGYRWIKSTQKFSGKLLCNGSKKGYKEIPANLAKCYERQQGH